MSAPLLLGLMTVCFLAFGYLGVPVAFSLMAGVFIGASFTDVTFPAIVQKMFDGMDSEALLAIPFFLLANGRTRGTVWGCVTASISIEVGMWLERFLIVVPSLSNPRLPLSASSYIPSWVEVSLFAAFVSIFILLYAVFTKLFPIISIWEVGEGREHSVQEVTERVESYLPNASEARHA